MRRIRRSAKKLEQVETEVSNDLVNFDDVLNRELDAPSVIDLEQEPSLPAVIQTASLAALETPQSDVTVPSQSDEETIARPQGNSTLQDSTEEENAALRAELLGAPAVKGPEPLAVEGSLAVAVPAALPIAATNEATVSGAPAAPAAPANPTAPARGAVGFDRLDFWDSYDEATASADLFAVPPAAITVVVGSLDVAMAVAERCQTNHWVSECDVFVLTERPEIVGQPTWTPLRRPSDVVAVLEDGQSDFPLIVLDIPRELPAWIRPLVARLRQSGVGLVHYVLDDDPSDEDLATWHGELGRPAVLDLAFPVTPERVLELLDRGEPVSSVAGMDISTELLLALRLSR